MRIGDYIDAYCSRCKRGTDHAVVGGTTVDAKRKRGR